MMSMKNFMALAVVITLVIMVAAISEGIFG